MKYNCQFDEGPIVWMRWANVTVPFPTHRSLERFIPLGYSIWCLHSHKWPVCPEASQISFIQEIVLDGTGWWGGSYHNTHFVQGVYTVLHALSRWAGWPHPFTVLLMGKWKTLKCGNQSTKTEVQKPKYRNRSTEVRRKAFYRCLVHYWPTTVPCCSRQKVTVSKRCETRTLTHRTPVSTNTVI